ncbi:hypothetical protein [Nesterenkonia sp. HG001]|uniref:hypothetical protein n=1 Tax=Nesterenkonia sp. HG001 TaxID=2983207 RepID=UPI002AC5598C|nr:hypothetical protein [Nesterenkonia sp. HG001]MDZ5076725.1 hypothetical protein [Nesterenkonia sp. HG001]
MSDFPLITTPYPSLHPALDISSLLVNGWTERFPQNVSVGVTPNVLFYNFRLVADDATNWIFMEGLPPELRPPQNLHVTALTPVGATLALVRASDGAFMIPSLGRNALDPPWDRTGELTVTGAVPRGAGT